MYHSRSSRLSCSLAKAGSSARHRHHVKRQVPGREPGILPLVGHRDDVAGEDIGPVAVAPAQPLGRRRRVIRVALQPVLDDVMVELLRPEEAGVGLPRDPARLGVGRSRQRRVELVRLALPHGQDLLERVAERSLDRGLVGPEPEPDDPRLARAEVEGEMRAALGALERRVDRLGAPVDDALADRVLDERRKVRGAVKQRRVGLVLREKERGRAALEGLDVQEHPPERRVVALHAARGDGAQLRLEPAALVAAAPGPRVAKPEGRKQVEGRAFGAPVGRGDPDADVIRSRLRVFHHHVKVAAGVENPGLGQLELRVVPRPRRRNAPQLLIGEGRLRILVERAQPRMGRRRVEVEMALLHVLAVVALGVGQPEKPLLEDGVLAIPQRDGKAQAALPVADAEQPVLAPAVRPAARLLVGEIAPALAIGRVVLAHRAPLPFGEVGSPAFPVAGPVARPRRGGPARRFARVFGAWSGPKLRQRRARRKNGDRS